MRRTPLRFVLLCDSLDLPTWQANCLLEAIRQGVAELAAIVVREPRAGPSFAAHWPKRWADRNLILWRLFNRFYVDRVSKAVVTKDVWGELGDAPIFVERPLRTGLYSESLTAGCMEFVEHAKPDFVLRFGFGILSGSILSCAKYGVWSFHHGDPHAFRGQPPAFWEIMKGASSVGAILQVVGDELDAGRILHAGHFRIIPQSYVKTRDGLYTGTTTWVRRTCADIIENGWRPPMSLSREGRGPVYRQPTNREMMTFLRKMLFARFKTQLNYKLHRQVWNCAVVPAPIHEVAGLEGRKKQRVALLKAHWMPTARGTFSADPFGYEKGSGEDIRILFERYKWAENRGEIAAIDYTYQQFGDVLTIKSAQTHLSYPFVISLDGRLYFIPENSQGGNVSAFEIEAEGEVNPKGITLLNSNCLDATLLRSNEMYYMFSLNEMVSTNTDLDIYFSKHLAGPWTPHPLNPVKSDIRSARPAGTPFFHEGRLYRPSQDCASHYGSAVAVNEIVVLSEHDFKEIQVSDVRPPADSLYKYGLHTLSAIGDFTLIDGARKEIAIFPESMICNR